VFSDVANLKHFVTYNQIYLNIFCFKFYINPKSSDRKFVTHKYLYLCFASILFAMQNCSGVLLSLPDLKLGFIMHKTLFFSYFTLGFLLLILPSAQAQLHFKVGYTPTYFDPEENNRLLESYNERNPWLENKFNALHWSHGLDVGLRYRIGFVGLEASWRASFANTKAEGNDPVTNADFQKKFIYRFNTYTIGMENYVGRFGLGANLGYNKMSIRERATDDRFDVLSTDQWIGTIFLGLYTKHEGSISFGIRPFVQVPLNAFDITKLATNLSEPVAGELFEKEHLVFGLSLVIWNGY
jgi:hypothetical protein